MAFLVLSVYLGGHGTQAPDAAHVLRRARRLLLPWLVWFAVYGGVNVARGGDIVPAGQGLLAGTLAGPSVHLWYLPFAFGCLLLLDVARAHVPARALALAAGVLAVGLVAAVPAWRPVSLQLHAPLLQWADALAPVAVGVFWRGAGGLPRAVVAAVSAALLAAVVGVCVATNWGAGFGPALLLGFVATGWLVARTPRVMQQAVTQQAVERDMAAPRYRLNLQPLSDCTFGIYLVHSGVFLFLLLTGYVPEPFLPEAIFVLSLALVYSLRRLAPRWASVWS